MLLISVFSFAQKGINNFIPNPSYTFSKFNNILIQNDTIITYGINIKKIGNDYKQGIYLSKRDTFGNLISDKFIIDSITNVPLSVTVNYGNFIRTSKGTFACIAAKLDSKVIFTELDNDFEILQTKYFFDSTYQSNFGYKILEIKDGYLLYGNIQWQPKKNATSGVIAGFVRKIDKQGNTQWIKYYSPVTSLNADNNVLSISAISDNKFTFLLMSSKDLGVLSSELEYFYTLYTIDSQGNTIKSWRTKTYDPDFYHIDKIVSATEDEIIVSGRKFIDYYNAYRNFQPYFAAFNSDFKVKWQKYYGFKSIVQYANTLVGFQICPDGNYIGVGTMGVAPPIATTYYAWLHKFTPQGNEIWGRTIATPYNLPSNVKKRAGDLNDVATLSSGSIVAVGVSKVGSDTYGYLVKMTSDGCLDTLFKCDKTIASKEVPTKANFSIEPNPANDWIQLRLSEESIDSQVNIFDIQGKLVYSGIIQSTNESINSSNWAKGVYIVTIQNDIQRMSQKLIIE